MVKYSEFRKAQYFMIEGTPDSPLNPELLMDLVSQKMPFGRYQGRLLCDLPEPYLVWFHQKGFPEGKIGILLAAIYEIKLNGLEYLLEPVKKLKR
jgi:hypothetical protein